MLHFMIPVKTVGCEHKMMNCMSNPLPLKSSDMLALYKSDYYYYYNIMLNYYTE